MNSNEKRTYNSIYLKRTSHNDFNKKSLVKVYKVKDGKQKGKFAHVTIKVDKNGEQICVIKFKDTR